MTPQRENAALALMTASLDSGAGVGPFVVLQVDAPFFITDTRNGQEVAFLAYQARKTANRKARELNAASEAEAVQRATDADFTSASEDDVEAAGALYDRLLAEQAQRDADAFPSHVLTAEAMFPEAFADDLAAAEVDGDAPEESWDDKAFEAEIEDDKLRAEEDLAGKVWRETPRGASPIIATREDWLNAAAVLICARLSDLAGVTPDSYRVTCGWPSRGGTAKKRVTGQCWNAAASDDAHAEIFISPMEADAAYVACILGHELIHAALPVGTGHKGPFIAVAKSMGYIKPFTQSGASLEVLPWLDNVVAALPAYPHAKINPNSEGDKKPQTNRQLLAECVEVLETGEACGFKARLARKWIVEVGAPICPRCNVQMVADLGDDEPEGEGEK